MSANRRYTNTREAVLEALSSVKTSPDVDNFMAMVRLLLASLDHVSAEGRDVTLESALTGAVETIVQRRSRKLMTSWEVLFDQPNGEFKHSVH